MTRDLARWPLRLASLLACLLFWQQAASHKLDLLLFTFTYVPTPGAVLDAAWQLLASNTLLAHLGSSLARVFAGYGVAALLGVSLGLLIGRSKWLEDTLMPPLEVLRPIPAVAWIPLAILMFPSSELSMVFITFTGAVFPILREVVLPGALPSIVTGLAIGMGTSWFCLVTAEMIAGQFGIGYYTWESYTLQNYPDIIVGMLLIGVLGMGSSALVKRLGAVATPWIRRRA